MQGPDKRPWRLNAPARSRWPASDGLRSRLVSAQAPSAVILIRAERFKPNPATAADNAFQADAPAGQSEEETAIKAHAEMDAVADALRASGVRVHVFSDEDHTRPDSVFPNNWLSTHAGGSVAVYPMYASNRRHERRADVLELLKSEYRVQTIVDYSGLEPDGIFLEGTGAMVLDICPAWRTPPAATARTPTSSSASARTSATSRWLSTPSTPTAYRSTTPT